MTDSVDDIKDRLKGEETAAEANPAQDIVEELRDVGKQFADTLNRAWNSEERNRVEEEVRAGVKAFGEEIDKVISGVRSGNARETVKEQTERVNTRVNPGDAGEKAKEGVVSGLRWLSTELGKVADRFTPHEDGVVEGSAEEIIEVVDDKTTSA